MGVTAKMPETNKDDGLSKQAFEMESPKLTHQDDDEPHNEVCMGFTLRQISMLALIPGIYAMMTLGAEYYTPLKPFFTDGAQGFMGLDQEKWTQVLSIHKIPKIFGAIPAGFVVSMLSPSLCFISGLIGSSIALWMMYFDTVKDSSGNLYLAGRIVDGAAKILMLNVSEATLMAWLTKAQRPTGKGAQALGSSLANFMIGPLYGGIVNDTPSKLPLATAVAASIVTAAVVIVTAMSFFVQLSPPSYKSKIKMGLGETISGYFRWIKQHPRHMTHLVFTWLTVICFEIPWGSVKGELRTILGDCWKNSIPATFWAKGPKGCQGLVSLALALTLKAAASFDTIYLVPVGAAMQFAGWFILYFRLGYTWSEGNRTFMVILSQFCNVIGYSLQYVFVCPLVFNLTYLPYAPMSIGISIMAGQGAQWLFQTFILGPAERHKKTQFEADKAAGDVKRKLGFKDNKYYAPDFDDIIFWLMFFCSMAFVLSIVYIFVIRKCYSTKDEPIEEHDELDENDDNRV